MVFILLFRHSKLYINGGIRLPNKTIKLFIIMIFVPSISFEIFVIAAAKKTAPALFLNKNWLSSKITANKELQSIQKVEWNIYKK